MGQQGPPGETEEAETATGAVNSEWPGRRSTGPPHLDLRRQYGCAIEHLFRIAKQEVGFTHFEGRNYRALMRHLTLALVVMGFASEQAAALRKKTAR